jgi:hypothetical protein
MDEADNELRQVIIKLWPNLAKRTVKLHEGGTKSLLDLVVPPKSGKYSLPFLHLKNRFSNLQNYMAFLVIQN